MAAYEAHGETDEWYTPKYIFDALGVEFDLDVAAPKNGPRYVPTKNWFWEKSLGKDWFGFVWMNPPFGHQKQKRMWLEKFFKHRNGIALLPDRTSAPWFQEFVPNSDTQLWVSPKIKFERPDGTIGESPGTGTVLLGSGTYASKVLQSANSLGFTTITTEGEENENCKSKNGKRQPIQPVKDARS